MADQIFTTLPISIRRRIDEAFDIATKGYLARIPSSNDTQAGFVLEEDDIPTHHQHDDDPPIPLSRVPAALKLLDIPPDDEETLAVFRKAASGWGNNSTRDVTASGGSYSEEDGGGRGRAVSREDWRAVCAVLLEDYPGHPDGFDAGDDSNKDADSPMSTGVDYTNESDGDAESDEYYEHANDESTSDEDDSDEEFEYTTHSRQTKRRKTTESSSALPSSSTHDSPTLTLQQSLECKRAFALFFPDVSADSEELLTKKITVRDLSRAATLLKEKIKAEEMVELLEEFTTSADKSMSLGDFEQMMIVAKMI